MLRRVLKGAAILLALLVVVAGLWLLLTPLGRYLARAGWEEAKILAARRPIVELVGDSSVDAALRAKLALVLEARDFAQDSLGLPAKEAFTQFTQLERDTLVLLISGARRDALVPVLWRFPLVGRLPYKGFFDPEEALAAARALESDGFDSYVRPASAFSTLGWFNDPLLSTTLAQDSVNLVNTVIHELTHNLYFAPGDAAFNESLANFVGARGAEWFFRARGDSLSAARAAARWEDDRRLAAFWGLLYRELDSTFVAHPGDSLRERRLTLRDSIYRGARATLQQAIAPRLRTISPLYAERVALDNAALLARRVYLSDLDRFERELMAAEGSLRRALNALIAAHKSGLK